VTSTDLIRGDVLAIQRLLPTLLLLAWTSQAAAQSPIPSTPTEGSVTTEQIETAIEAVQARDGLDEELRGQIVDLLRDSQAQIQNKVASEAAAEAFEQSLETAPAETARLREQLETRATTTPTPAELGVSDGMALDQIEQLLSREAAALAGVQTRLAGLESEIETQADRPGIARQRLNEIRARLDELSVQINADPPPGESAILTDARKLNAELRRDARAAELRRLDQELLSNSVRLELRRAQRDVAAREAAEAQQRVDLLQALVNSQRQVSVQQAQAEAARAERAASGSHPEIRSIAQRNTKLINELPAIAAAIERTTERLAEVESAVQEIEQSLVRARQRLDVGGVSQAIGRLLVEERRNLPQVSQYRSEVRDRRRTLSEIGLAQVEIEEMRRDLSPLDPVIEDTMQAVADDVTDPGELAALRDQVRQLLVDRRAVLTQAGRTYTSYLRALSDLDVAQRRLLAATNEYRDFLDQHLLWIPSTGIIGAVTIVELGDAFSWLASPGAWMTVGRSLVDSLRSNALPAALMLLLLAALSVSRRPLNVRFKAINARVGRLSTDSIGLTLAALGLSLVRALPLPLLLWSSGVALEHSGTTHDLTLALSAALKVVAPMLYNLLLFRVVFARNGVARVHFGWQTDNLDVIRRQLDRLILVGVPLVALAVVSYASPDPVYRESLGRIAFIVFMLLLAFVIRPLSDPRKGSAAGYYQRRPDSWLSKLRWLWFVLEVGVPVGLALLAALGYLYTAATLTGHLIDTIWLVLTLVIVNLVILRWLALARRKIAWRQALEKRAARLAEKHDEGDAEHEPDEPAVERKPLDLDAVDQQTRRLSNAGLVFVGVVLGWGIWSGVLPALGVFEEISLWARPETIDGVETSVPVTLADLLLGLFVAGVTWIAAKNLPGLMEVAVLQRLDLQPGSGYTINTLLRYSVVTIGVISVLSIIGWNWSRIQWLVAALSVGLGFGLQEIVANFVSGLIILFERPVRVGDTVTVGELTGTVTRVRIRATTIRDWDRKEIIVPNKAFITEQVINWTLSDPITRIVVPVGVSYGSDVGLAHRVMQETLAKMPLVAEEPPPMVYFMGFGESSLDFNLYVYSRELSDRLPLMHAVHSEILEALRANGIEIPFPQRDLHLRSVDDQARIIGRPPPEHE